MSNAQDSLQQLTESLAHKTNIEIELSSYRPGTRRIYQICVVNPTTKGDMTTLASGYYQEVLTGLLAMIRITDILERIKK